MARKKSTILTEAELKVMEVLWDKGTATVGEVAEAQGAGQKVAYNTVLTFLRILEQKGYVGHTKQGRAFVYYPRVDRRQARRNAVGLLLDRFFDGSPGILVSNLLEEERLDPDELARIRDLIEKSGGE